MERRVARLVCVLALVAALGLVLATTLDPGSGTGTNLHAADDAAALVVGAHHAKPVPAPGGLVLAGLLLLATAAAAGASPAAPAAPLAPVPAAIRRRHGVQAVLRSADTAVACGWRGPPAPVPA